MKGYLNYKDVQKTLGIGKNKAYKIIREIRDEIGFEDSYESDMLPGLYVPRSAFEKKFPNALIKFG